MTDDAAESVHEAQPDVSEQRLARIYAEALLNLAQRDHEVTEILDELRQLVGRIASKHGDMEAFFTGEVVGRQRRGEVLKEAFQSRCQPVILQFLLVLNEHDRLMLLPLIVRELAAMIDQRNRKFPVQVRTAAPLADDQRERLANDLRKSFKLEPVLEVTVDPEILGGIIIRIGDWLFDGSVRNTLESLRKQLMEKSSHAIQSR
jgi:F-type H+-transporting ATPase subunit delta